MIDDSKVKEVYEIVSARDDEGRKIINDYCYVDTLGQGAFSKVKKVRNIKTNQEFAVKIINKRLLERKNKGFSRDSEGNVIMSSALQSAMKEIAILKKISHKNIIRLYEILHDTEKGKIIMINELASKGTVMKFDEMTGDFQVNEKLLEEGQTYYTENQLRNFLRDIISGLDYLHSNGVIHRDIKPDNVLVNNEGICKITDFNVSAMFGENQSDRLQKTEGTIYFYSPEMCNPENPGDSFSGKPLDMWALGVTLYIMTFNKLPIKERNEGDTLELLDLISKGEIVFPESETRTISDELKQLILCLLEKNPQNRITIRQLMKHPWINNNNLEMIEEEHKIIQVTEEEIKDSLNYFMTLLKMKTIAKDFRTKLKKISTKRLKNSTIEIQQEFFTNHEEKLKNNDCCKNEKLVDNNIEINVNEVKSTENTEENENKNEFSSKKNLNSQQDENNQPFLEKECIVMDHPNLVEREIFIDIEKVQPNADAPHRNYEENLKNDNFLPSSTNLLNADSKMSKNKEENKNYETRKLEDISNNDNSKIRNEPLEREGKCCFLC